ncbi:hypothetical protein CAPTEDRAFT_201662 [Capitella teleta]|uniref:Uncharacterized protein n=1 Tax=Capitella teleta TaxID=283909 RepID=R7U995_CAPTE|nr:hypothetical protein CAPTEDRAFT_201662 [Capitella teleta]|eukprot:ELT99705.1 hypothetical protein CAPTEDRAFT_201662 [Capitella teleta]
MEAPAMKANWDNYACALVIMEEMIAERQIWHDCLSEPTPQDPSPRANHAERSTRIIAWKQELEIPASNAEYYGYTLAFTEGSEQVLLEPNSVANDSHTETQIPTITDSSPTFKFHFKIRPYTLVNGAKKYDVQTQGIASVKARNWQMIAVGFFFGAITIIIIVAMLIITRRRNSNEGTNATRSLTPRKSCGKINEMVDLLTRLF